MITYIKNEFINNTDKLIEFLEYYEYCNIKIHSSYISFGRDVQSSPKSIVIYLKDNENLMVKDWATNQSADIFNYVIRSRNKTFREVISVAKQIVGVEDYCRSEAPHSAFQAFYAGIKRKRQVELSTYDERILDKYQPCGNERFLRDGISLQVQREFGIGYDIESQSITIPIYSANGDLIAVKSRINKIPEEYENKYFYLEKGMESQTLYGYCQNYEYLESADVVYIGESEKFVLQAASFGYRNCLGLGSGSISKKQVQLLLSLRPKKVVVLHDVGYCQQSVHKNIQMIMQYSRMVDVQVGFWDYFGKDYEDKISATDKGKEFFENVINNEIKYVERVSYGEKENRS